MLHRLRRLPTQARTSTLALLLVLVSGVPSARAEAPSAEALAEARLNEAKQKFDEGVRAFAERRYADAVRAFREADAIKPSAALSFNIARAYERVEDAPAALRWYRDYLRRSPSATNLAEVESRIGELALLLEARGVQQLSVLVEPVGAEVLIDQRPAGVAPFTTELSPGPHQLRVRASGYRERELEIVLEPRTPRDVTLSLEPLGSGTQPRATSDRALSASPPPMSDAGKRRFGITPWLVLGAGAASTLGALGFELARRSAESEAESAHQLDYATHFDAMQGRQTAARVLGVAGGALLLGGGALLLFNTPREPSRRVALSCTGSACAVAASGSFW